MMNCMMRCMERSQVKARYTGGRKGVPRTWLEMMSYLMQNCASIGAEEYDKDPLAQNVWESTLSNALLQYPTPAPTPFLAVEFMKARLQKEKQKAEALKAQLDAERQKNNTGDIGMPVIPSSFGLFFLSLRKKPVAVAYVETKVMIDDDYDCMLQGIIEPNAMLCDIDDVVLQDVPIGTLIRWPRAYVTPIAELSS
ncbi:hypothetical protein C5167_043879 [Papaver somniferum]|uniref:Uncharacterized protein n=1 Tax=Papaver somniferum TaxID=3469 RepID=A0A4Y7L9J9_PAPSO|nr:hypothetical protein C5167_043879 [Papaver somniferum]